MVLLLIGIGLLLIILGLLHYIPLVIGVLLGIVCFIAAAFLGHGHNNPPPRL